VARDGVANDHSMPMHRPKARRAWRGARLHLSGRAILKRVARWPRSLARILCFLRREDISTVDAVFAAAGGVGELDFLVHSIAYSDKNELKAFTPTPAARIYPHAVISCFSSPSGQARRGDDEERRIVVDGEFRRRHHVMPNYNVMGVAKAALDSSVRYLAADFGDRGIRVNAISPAGADHGGRRHHRRARDGRVPESALPLRRMITLDEIGGSALYLLSELSGGVTGEIHLSTPATTSCCNRGPRI